MIRLCAFLGNFGREYAGNRHNVAWQFLSSLPFSSSLAWQNKFRGSFSSWESPAGRIWLLKPETYVNASGESVAELMRFFHIEADEVMAVHDELEMPFGTFGYKFSGGLGGHNGLRSMEKHLGTRDFARLRFGIGRPNHSDVAGYVLSDFGKEEREALDCSVFPRAGSAFLECFGEGFDSVLEKYRKVSCL